MTRPRLTHRARPARATVAVLLTATTLLAAAPALAAPEPARNARAARTKRAPAPSPEAAARESFERALALFNAGDFAAALPLFERAYEQSGHRASTIRALAQCERALGHAGRAIILFREYLATQPRPADAPAIETTIAELDAAEAARLAALAPPPPPPPPAAEPAAPVVAVAAAPPPPPDGVRWAPIAAVSASALVTGAGVTLFALGKSDAATVEGAAPGTAYADVRDAADRAPALMTAGTVVASVGVVALGAAVYWLLASE